MIKLEVEDYCQDCLDFEPVVTKPEALYSCGTLCATYGDTIIRCEQCENCARLKEFFTNYNKGGKQNGMAD